MEWLLYVVATLRRTEQHGVEHHLRKFRGTRHTSWTATVMFTRKSCEMDLQNIWESLMDVQPLCF